MKLSLLLGILHQQQKSIAQDGPHSFLTIKEDIEGAEDEVFEVQFCTVVTFIMKAKGIMSRIIPL